MKDAKKLTYQIIERVRDSILSGTLKPGERVANERELMEEFGVSKATMREALRVLEAMGLIKIRKGVNGGAFVAEVDMKTTIHSVINFLHFTEISIKDLTMLRYFIEPQVGQLAALKRTEEDLENLRQLLGEDDFLRKPEIEKGIGFHCYLARITNNPMLILLIDFIDSVVKSVKSKLKLDGKFYRLVKEHHSKVLECLINRDAHAARIMMANDVVEVGKILARLSNCDPFDPSEIKSQRSVADRLLYSTYIQRVVYDDDPVLSQAGVISRCVGNSNLRLVSYPEKVGLQDYELDLESYRFKKVN